MATQGGLGLGALRLGRRARRLLPLILDWEKKLPQNPDLLELCIERQDSP